MTQTLKIEGMTCGSCEKTVRERLETVVGVKVVELDRLSSTVTVHADHLIEFAAFQTAFAALPKYQIISPNTGFVGTALTEVAPTTFWATYKPLLLIFLFIVGVAGLTALQGDIWSDRISFSLETCLHNFMTGFFLTFAFFKLLDVRAFADSFKMYDVIARRWYFYGLLYPFIELALGVLCLLHLVPTSVYVAEIAIMGIGSIGIIESLFNKRRIQCACLGTVFNLPMSRITLIENGTMIFTGILLLWLR